VFVVDPSNRLLYASLGSSGSDPSWFNSVRPDLMPMLDMLRKGGGIDADGKAWSEVSTTPKRSYRIAGIQRVLDRPGIVAAIAVSAEGEASSVIASRAPVMVSVQWLDADVLAEIASLLQLRNLHSLDERPPASDERIFELTDWQGHIIARLAW